MLGVLLSSMHQNEFAHRLEASRRVTLCTVAETGQPLVRPFDRSFLVSDCTGIVSNIFLFGNVAYEVGLAKRNCRH